ATTLTATDITLTDISNDFDSVDVLDAQNVTLIDTNSIALQSTSITGYLKVTARNSGEITNSGALSVDGTTTLTATGNNITLDNSSNDLNRVDVKAAQEVKLTDTDDIALQSTTIAGGLTVTAGGAITNSGALSVGGATTLTATDITLTDISNDFDSVDVLDAQNVTLIDTNSIALQSTSIT
ncbi:MAG: hypothetical protein GY701_31410, partial [Sulfitobacter sp.]|nr:hypothetical protein [Sulfitobacter sp.]